MFICRIILTVPRQTETSTNRGPPTPPRTPTLPTLSPSTTRPRLTTILAPSTTPRPRPPPTWHLEARVLDPSTTSLRVGPVEPAEDTRWPPVAPAPRAMSEEETSPTSVSAVIRKTIFRVLLLNFHRKLVCNPWYFCLENSQTYTIHK